MSELDAHIPEECRRSRVVRSTRRWLHKWHLNDIADRSGNDGRQQSLSVCSVGGSSRATSASRAGVIPERRTEGFGDEVAFLFVAIVTGKAIYILTLHS